MSGPNQSNSFLESRVSNSRNFMIEARPLLSAETLTVVGKSYKGTAFVPTQYWNLDKDDTIINTFKGELGSIEENIDNQSYLAGLTWLESGGDQLSFCRILGSGSYAGFRVGENIISGSSNPGNKGGNTFAKPGGIKGKTYFFGKFLEVISSSQDTASGYNDYFEQLGHENVEKLPIVTHVIMMPSGTVPSLKTEDSNNFNIINTANFDTVNKKLRNKKASNTFGTRDEDNFGAFYSKKSLLYTDLNDEVISDILYINGLSGSNESYRNELKLDSFDFKKIMWQDTSKLNTDSLYQNDRGNYLYVKFPCERSIFKETTGSDTDFNSFIVSGSLSPSSTQPDYEDFEDSFKKAKTPWVVSQIINRDKLTNKNVSEIENSDYEKIFRIHTYDDGEIGNRFRIRIIPVSIGKRNLNENKDIYSKFDIELYEYIEDTNSFIKLDRYNRLDLDSNSPDFIGRVLGTEHRYFDKPTGKIITKGLFRRTNPWIYVELNKLILDNLLDPSIIPAGFEEYPHINLDKNYTYNSENTAFTGFDGNNLNNICQTPIEFVHCLYKNNNRFEIEDPYWGISFDNIVLKKENLLNKKIGSTNITSNFKFNHPVKKEKGFVKNEELKFRSYAKYFKSNQSSILNNWVIGSSQNSFQNSFFHLEKIMITKKDNIVDWKYSLYRRDGKDINNIDSLLLQIDENTSLNLKELYEYLNIENELNNSTSKYMAFDLFTYGGFDGLDIFDTDKHLMNNNACTREESNIDINPITIDMYNLGLNLVKEYSNCTTDILSVPNISVNSVLKNFSKLRDNDPDFISLKEIGFVNNNNFFTGSMIINDKSIFKKQDTNDSLINDIRINSNPSSYFDVINSYNKNEFIVYNNLLGFIGLDLLEISPSIPTCMAMAINKFSPLDSLNILNFQDQLSIKYTSVLDLKYVYDNTTTDYNKNIEEVIKKGINVFSFQNNSLRLSSSNSTFDIRKSLTRQVYNSRILNSIKKDIKLNLFVNNDVLFSTNSRISNLNLKVQNFINEVLNKYRSSGIIKNYYTKISDNHNIKQNINDLENYILRGKILIEMFTNVGSQTNFLEINIQDTLSDLSLNSETNIGEKLITISI